MRAPAIAKVRKLWLNISQSPIAAGITKIEGGFRVEVVNRTYKRIALQVAEAQPVGR
jgi:hypothetical protein